MMSGVARCRQLGIQTPKSIAPPLLVAAPQPAGSVRIARLGPGGPSPRAALRLALRPRDGSRRAPRRRLYSDPDRLESRGRQPDQSVLDPPHVSGGRAPQA